MLTPITMALKAILNVQNGESIPRRRKRRRRRYQAMFEALACDRHGSKINGTAYGNGKLTGDARCYQFRDGGADQDGSAGEAVIALVQERLTALVDAADIDLIYLRFVAGLSQAELARDLGCHRSSIKRREDRVLATLRADPQLRRAAGLPD